MQQLLYGRDKSDYKILSKSKSLSYGAASVLISDYLGYEFVQNQSEYSDISKEPISISYSVTNLDGYLGEDIIVVSKSGRYLNYTTPSRYSHAKLFDIDKDSFKDKFFQFFNSTFVESQETKNYKNDEIDNFIGDFVEWPKTSNLSEKQLKVVLYKMFDSYRSVSKPIYLMIDVVGDDYNTRSMDIIRQIYENIPYFMRKSMGFVSYGSFNQIYSSRIKLVIIPRMNIQFCENIVIDLSDIDLNKVSREISEESKAVVDYILGLEENEKVKLFNDLYNDPHIYRKTMSDIYNLCKSKKIWSEQSDFDKMDNWIHNIINCNELEEELFNIMLDNIEKDLNSDLYNEYLEDILYRDESITLGYLNEGTRLYDLLLFEDIISVDYQNDLNISLKIENKIIGNWWKRNILTILRTKFNGYELLENIKAEIKKYEVIDFQGQNYNSLKEYMKNLINQIIVEEEVGLENYILEERKNISNLIDNINNYNNIYEIQDSLDLVIDNYNKLVFDTNKNYLKQVYGENFKDILKYTFSNKEKKIDFNNMKEFILKNKMYLPEDIYKFVEEEENKVKKEIFNSLDLNNIQNLNQLRNCQSSISVSDKNEIIEEMMITKLKEIIDKMDVEQFNDSVDIDIIRRIICDFNFFEPNDIERICAKVNLFLNRTIVLDLDDTRSAEIEIDKKTRFISSLVDDNFDKNIYEFNIIIDNDKSFMIKWKYIDKLIDYINRKPEKKSFFNKFKSKKIEIKDSEFYTENKLILDYINDIKKN